jgi:RNA-directed DNA polymerase
MSREVHVRFCERLEVKSLGPTLPHICGQTWKTGKFLLLRKTIHQRFSAKLRALKEELRRRKHLSVAELGKWLRSVVQGYFNYHAVPGNLASLRSFRLQVIRRWLRALQRRSQKDRMTWPRLVAIAERWLPKPSILHPYPNLRFDATHPRSEPHAAILHVRIRAGGVR